jgi:hypothetical protein
MNIIKIINLIYIELSEMLEIGKEKLQGVSHERFSKAGIDL